MMKFIFSKEPTKLYRSFLVLFLLGFGMENAYSSQEIAVKDNGMAYAGISKNELTRISVENDRIKDLKGPAGVYSYRNDLGNGAVYLKLLDASNTKPFSVFIGTELNHNYLLRLTPRQLSTNMILLRQFGTGNPNASHWEESSPYTKAVTELMNAMVNDGEPPEGYSVEDNPHPKNQYLGSIAVLKLIKVYSGAHLEGRVYQLSNRTNVQIHVTESEFYQSGDRAIALDNLKIDPNGETQVYKVVSHDE